MDRMPPASAAVAADPAFHCTQGGRRICKMRVVELLVDLPRTVATMEFESTRNDSFRGRDRTVRSQRSSDGHGGIIRLALALDYKLQEWHGDIQSPGIVQ